jgi:hypothetical protein
MNDVAGGSRQRVRWPTAKQLGVGVAIVCLLGIVIAAVVREAAPPKGEPVEQGGAVGNTVRPALSAAEEGYAAALWPIHENVKQSAVRMTFAGLAYKSGDLKADAFLTKVRPLVGEFDRALAGASKLRVPEPLRETHAQYLEAIRLYRESARVMVAAVAEKREQDLIPAQEMSSRAASLVLQVGEGLWPGEYKPN